MALMTVGRMGNDDTFLRDASPNCRVKPRVDAIETQRFTFEAYMHRFPAAREFVRFHGFPDYLRADVCGRPLLADYGSGGSIWRHVHIERLERRRNLNQFCCQVGYRRDAVKPF